MRSRMGVLTWCSELGEVGREVLALSNQTTTLAEGKVHHTQALGCPLIHGIVGTPNDTIIHLVAYSVGSTHCRQINRLLCVDYTRTVVSLACAERRKLAAYVKTEVPRGTWSLVTPAESKPYRYHR